MTITVRSSDLFIRTLDTRIPFEFGIASMTAVPQLVVRTTVTVDGRIHRGVAAENLVPNWFTKDPELSYETEVDDMIAVTERACEHAAESGSSPTVYELWRQTYTKQRQWAERTDHPPLLWGFGTSLIERAVIDAFCRARGTSFSEALCDGEFGVELGEFFDELSGESPSSYLSFPPVDRIAIRHTVGRSDPLTEDEIAPADAVADELPLTLEDHLREYGVRYFKLLLGGNVDEDVTRLRRILAVIEGSSIADPVFTLDANEQYASVDTLRQFWNRVVAEPDLEPLRDGLRYIEQPLPRATALDDEIKRAFGRWQDRPPIIIDESGGSLTALERALECGYAGTSYKSCKGVFKGIANACLIAHRDRQSSGDYILSAEDLSTVGLSLLQDTAVVAALGLDNVQRNGHHYFRGLTMYPNSVSDAIGAAHDDVYRPNGHEFHTLYVRDGAIELGSINDAPFGIGVDPDRLSFTPVEEWEFASLGVDG